MNRHFSAKRRGLFQVLVVGGGIRLMRKLQRVMQSLANTQSKEFVNLKITAAQQGTRLLILLINKICCVVSFLC